MRISAWLLLPILWMILLLSIMPDPAWSQDEEGRQMSSEEAAALETWARELLAEIQEREGPLSGPSMEMEVQRLWALYFLAVDHSSRLDDARELAAALLNREPPSWLRETVEVLAGALEVVRAKHSRWPPNKLKFLRAGMMILDDGVSRNPDSAEARYLRLVSCYYLPFFLDREEIVAQDFQALAEILPEGSRSMPAPILEAAVTFVLEKGDMEDQVRTQLQGLIQ